ncbi:hypothetical protein [Lysinibacillus piscis]|uniref:Anti-sigma factor n=1 Tax=Lysinibacillus piscis TaxID=2518931 RepID=A0ABQ5NIV5_9BACI|nr:hypothetical protein [Lysinibacillus sp. KH24]GLC88038.1 hypothetical protein LYSBPC_11650 [Lysinibacillus sp. KH24]
MDKFDQHVKEEVQGYLHKHVYFSHEESEQIRSKTANTRSRKKFQGVYYTVLVSAVVLFTVLSIPVFKTLNFDNNSDTAYFAIGENSINGKHLEKGQEMLSTKVINELQQSIINHPEKYKLQKASLNYWSKSGDDKDTYSSKEITLSLSFQSQKNSYFTQVFEGDIELESQFKVLEKVGDWQLIPETQKPSDENNYVIAALELLVNQKKYTIIVQTYDIHDDFYANPYSKTELLEFIESLQPELAVKALLAKDTML